MTDDAEPTGTREHSASSIALAKRCRRAWWLRYGEGWRMTEVPWQVIADWEASHGRSWFWAPQCESGGQRGAALGKETHRLREIYLVDGAEGIDWESLPGQLLHAVIEHLPPPGSLPRSSVEHEFSYELCGVRWKGLIDGLWDGVVEDLKTSKDIAAYALLPDATVAELGLPEERALSNDLQASIYTCYDAKAWASGGKDSVPLLWLYTETGPTRRSLPVYQEMNTAKAMCTVSRAAALARELETYQSADDAAPDAMRCDDYGGCWYRGRHCFAPRPWGRLMRAWERQQQPTEVSSGSDQETELRGSQGRGRARGRKADVEAGAGQGEQEQAGRRRARGRGDRGRGRGDRG